MTVVTLGAMGDVQVLDGLSNEDTKRYMHHYNFPPYSTGEAKPMRGPGRREIGHGALAERALEPMIPSEEEFPYAIRLVSEVMSSNGSTSQASRLRLHPVPDGRGRADQASRCGRGHGSYQGFRRFGQGRHTYGYSGS